MRKYLLISFWVALLGVSFSACKSDVNTDDIWNSIDNLEDRVASLEKVCSQMNGNIASLQALVQAVQENVSITSVSPLMENGKEVGYTITFSKGNPIVIYHGTKGDKGEPGKNGTDGKDGANGADGKDGVDGKDGKDGITPIVGVAKDVDGIYYWTLNGKWLTDTDGNKVKAVGSDGKDGTNGTNGTDGEDGKDGINGTNGTNGVDGKDGKDGKDGVTPQLKIENGNWMLSVDNGATWTNLGVAQGADGTNGKDGKDGKDGDSFFSSIDYTSDTNWVIFTLSDGKTQIKLPTWKAYEALQALCSRMNANIDALQDIVTGLQDGEAITSVAILKDVDNNEIGYTLTFKNTGTVNIYHGKDGADGADGTNGTDGANGITPVIGVVKDQDGLYYWTLNGKWLTDADGNKIKAVGTDGKDGLNGTNGTDGANGKNGKDGVTPQLKIENGNWMLSVDNGETWTDLGTAQGADGEDGVDGKNGDSFFSNIDYTSDSNWVILTLADGETQIKLPTWTAYEALQTLCTQMNANILALQATVAALEKGETITKITELKDLENKVIGYTLTFKNAGNVNIYHGKDGKDGIDGTNGSNGVDGATPVIGVAKDIDGIYYWTLNGDWLKDTDGNKIKAVGIDGKDGVNGVNGTNGTDGTNGVDGVTPKLKIVGDKWMVSYDNEQTWIEAGSAVNGDAVFFTSVTTDEDYVYLQLKSSTETIKIPRYKPLSIAFSETSDIRVLGGQTYSITYTLTGATDKTQVKALAQDGFKTVVEKGANHTGTIKITAPNPMVDSEVLVFVSDGDERTFMRSINFVKGVINITTQSYTVPSDGGVVEVSLSTNINYSVNIPNIDQFWISVVPGARAAMREEVIKLQVEANGAGARTSIIELVDSEGEVTETIQISQASGRPINVATAGTLNTLISASEKYLKSSLKLTGSLDSDDIAFIRDMAGVDNRGNATAGILKHLDISECNIVEGGNGYTYYSPTQISNNYTSTISKTIANTLPNGMFSKIGLVSVLLPESITVIDTYAFNGNESLITVSIPNGVTINCGYNNMTGTPFGFSNIQSIIVDESNSKYKSIDGVLYDKQGKTLIAFPGGKAIVTFPNTITSMAHYAFMGAQKLTEVVLPEGLTEVSNGLFRESKVVSVVIPEGVTKLWSDVFLRCVNLKNVQLPESLNEIGGYVFNGSGIESITLPKNLSSFNNETFGNCTQLREIHCTRTTPPTLPSPYSQFANLDKLSIKLYVPEGSLNAYVAAEGWKDLYIIED